MLYYPESNTLGEFPSPESLKQRIIISTKPPKEYLEKDHVSASTKLRDASFDVAADASQNCNDLEGYDSDQDLDDFEISDPKSGSGLKVAPEYKHLITIHAGKPKGTLKDGLKVAVDKVRRLSLSEQELEKAALSHGTDVVRYFIEHFY